MDLFLGRSYLTLIALVAALLLAGCGSGGGGGNDSGSGENPIPVKSGLWEGTFVSSITGETEHIIALVNDTDVMLYSVNGNHGTFGHTVYYSAIGAIERRSNQWSASFNLFRHQSVGDFNAMNKLQPYGLRRGYTLTLTLTFTDESSVSGEYSRNAVIELKDIVDGHDEGAVRLSYMASNSPSPELVDLAGNYHSEFDIRSGETLDSRLTHYSLSTYMDDSGNGLMIRDATAMNYTSSTDDSVAKVILSRLDNKGNLFNAKVTVSDTWFYDGLAARYNNSLLIIGIKDTSQSLVFLADSGSGLAPVYVDAQDQLVDTNTGVTLASTTGLYSPNTTTYEWTQLSGTSVNLNNPQSLDTTFLAPDISGIEVLSFGLSLKAYGQIVPIQEVDITVRQPTLTKHDDTFNVLPYDATSFECVSDTETNLAWETKTDDGGFQDKDNSYTWWSGSGPDGRTGGICDGLTECNTYDYIQAINAMQICGFSDWRLPTETEILTIIGKGYDNFFPNIGRVALWTSTPYSLSEYIGVDSITGYPFPYNITEALKVRLVRDM